MAISGGDGSIILTTKVDEAGLKKGLGSMQKSAKNFGAGIAKSFAIIGVAAATATVAITKMAVSAYADYEQLVGGVETLFKGSAQKVIDYANDAFYTAGVSANEYMQQVTSFSASLISSTAGDTEKAADIANMALIDISDNANKMGTSMEAVTTAYQGFAKQQYMLLDNLKLGYGGTKTEMERLLKDAQALTGVKYDINNLADVYSAIHAIQENLGIAGTTAKEAEKTISGSANMMKASWQNVLSAIAGGGDLDRAINNLVYSITKYFENIVPVVQRSLVGIGRLIEQVAPLLVQNVASALIQSIPSLINAIYQMIVGLAKGIWEGIKALFTGGSGSVTADIKTSVGGIASSAGEASTGMEELGDATEKAGKQAKKTLAAFDDLNILADSSSGGASKAPELSTGDLEKAVGEAKSEMSIITEDNGQPTFLDRIRDTLQEIQELFVGGFWDGFVDYDFTELNQDIDSIKESIVGIVNDEDIKKTAVNAGKSFVKFFGTAIGSMASIGKSSAEGIIGGIEITLSDRKFMENIKLNLVEWFDIQAEASSVGSDFFTALATVFSANSGENAQQMNSGLINIFATAFSEITTLGSKLGLDIIKVITKPITENSGELKKALDNLYGIVDSVLVKPVKTLLESMWNGIKKFYDENVSPWFGELSESISWLVSVITDNFNNYIAPTLQDLGTEIQTLMDEHIAPMFEEIMEFLTKLNEMVPPLWNEVLVPLLTWLIDTFTPEITTAFSEMASAVGNSLGYIFDFIGYVFSAFNGLLDFMNGVGKGDWEAALIGWKNHMYQQWNAMVSIVEGAINLIIDMLNGLIRQVNSAFANSAIGQMVGMNNSWSGSVNRSTNIEDYMTESSNNPMNNWKSEIVLEIDGREFGRAVVEQGNRENRRIGTRLVTVQ